MAMNSLLLLDQKILVIELRLSTSAAAAHVQQLSFSPLARTNLKQPLG
jgi:hypothetical protein